MTHRFAWIIAVLAGVSPLQSDDTKPINCANCATWNAEIDPFRIHDGVYYVGTRGLSSVLIDTGEELILLDGALPQSAQRIIGNIRALGFEPRQVRYIVNSHEHYDHAGGIAALARLTGAQVLASRRGAAALRGGNAAPDDPQAGFGDAMRFPPVENVRVVADGESIELGRITLTAHYTPGHTPGATSWTWRNCGNSGEPCLEFVFAESLNPVSAPGFRYSDDTGRARAFERSIEKFRALPCDALIPLHPSFREASGTASQFVGDDKCADYARRLLPRWRKRLQEEAKSGDAAEVGFTPPAASQSRAR